MRKNPILFSEKKKEIKEFLIQKFVNNHIKNITKLKSPEKFNVNPFLFEYLANFFPGESLARSKAEALIYPKALGTSITTTFGNHMQTMCVEILEISGSRSKGLDIEYYDFVDKRIKYCQTKSGPNSINKSDVKSIKDDFVGVINLAKANRMKISRDDFVIGLWYGTTDELNSFFKELADDYAIYCGKDFWFRLTGDDRFYSSLIKLFGEIARATDCSKVIETAIKELAKNFK